MFKKVFHIALVLYLLIITSGVAVSKHYCGGDMVSFSVYLKAQSCSGMDEEMEDHCCDDTVAFFQLEEDFTPDSQLKFAVTPGFSFVVPEFTFLSYIFSTHLSFQNNQFVAYSPPLLVEDIPTEVQSFLI